MKDDLEDAISDVIECAVQAPSDLCGDQREWYLPRLSRAMAKLMARFPQQANRALEKAKDPWGELLVSKMEDGR